MNRHREEITWKEVAKAWVKPLAVALLGMVFIVETALVLYLWLR